MAYILLDSSMDDNFAFRWAIFRNQDQLVELLFKNETVDPRVIHGYPMYIMYLRTKTLELLLNDNRMDPTVNDNFLIRESSKRGRIDLVKLLLKDGRADPAVGDNSPIIEASYKGHTKVVKALLEDIRVDPTTGKNHAMEWAIADIHPKTVIVLSRDGRAGFWKTLFYCIIHCH